MRRQIVVKRNGDGKRLSSASRTRRGEEVRRWNDSVTRAEVLDLTLEKGRRMRPDEIARGVRSSITNTVVDQRKAGLPGCNSSRPLDNRRQRVTEDAKEYMGDAL
jgi:hypothetical protein